MIRSEMRSRVVDRQELLPSGLTCQAWIGPLGLSVSVSVQMAARPVSWKVNDEKRRCEMNCVDNGTIMRIGGALIHLFYTFPISDADTVHTGAKLTMAR